MGIVGAAEAILLEQPAQLCLSMLALAFSYIRVINTDKLLEVN